MLEHYVVVTCKPRSLFDLCLDRITMEIWLE